MVPQRHRATTRLRRWGDDFSDPFAATAQREDGGCCDAIIESGTRPASTDTTVIRSFRDSEGCRSGVKEVWDDCEDTGASRRL